MDYNLIEKIDKMTDCLYQEKMEEGYAILNGTIVELTRIVGDIVKNPGQTVIDEKKILDSMDMAVNAMQMNDPVLLADLFHFEIKPELLKII